MASVNKAILLGNLGKDPELRYTPGGQPVANFSLATTERFTDKSGQAQKRTEWHNIVVWGKQAELANQYLKKGRSLYLEGRITTRSWDDRDGNKRYKTEIVANVLQFLGGPPAQSPSAEGDAGATAAPAPESSEEFSPAAVSSSQPEASVHDDLPF